MNTRTFIKGALLSAVVVAAASTAAQAAPVTEAGETIGLSLGAALPQGVYFVDTASYLSRSNSAISAVVNIPVVAWSTPWDFLGGHIEAYAAMPMDTLAVKGASGGGSGFYNPALLVGEAWALGGGWSFSNFVGGYGPMKADGLASNNWVFNERPSIAWSGNDWALALNGIYGVVGKNLSTHVRSNPDYLNLDFSALKTIGKWNFGPVAYYTTDTTNNTDVGGYQTNQFAIGGMVAYNFPGISTQLILTQDVSASNLGGTGTGTNVKDTRGFVRFIVPLY